jgi:dipeptidyl aminopeptidase/acylaminoacyl peptidase
MLPRPPAHPAFLFLVCSALLPLPAAEDATIFRTPSPPLAALVDAPPAPTAVLSPDRRRLLLLERPAAPSIGDLAQPELKLAGIRLNPATQTRSREADYLGLSFLPIEGGPAQPVTGLPPGARIADYEWNRDGRQLALTVVRERGLELWVVDLASATARRLTGPGLNGLFGEPMVWLDAETILIRRVPAGRGPAPAASAVPAGPIVQENSGQRAGARTYDGLLGGPHDAALFEYHGACELARVTLDGTITPLPVRGLLAAVSPSPDGRYILVESIQRPYSYQVPASRFPLRLEVYDRDGRRLRELAALPLHEGTATSAVRPGPRGVIWRADAPATLAWAQDLGRTARQADRKTVARDGWFSLAAPFTGEPVELQRFEYRISSVQWGDDTLALVTETWSATRRVRTWRVAPARPAAPRTLLFDRKSEDRYSDPGRAATRRNEFGRLVIARSPDGGRIFLHGAGASPQGDRPFLDEFDLAARKARRLWRSAPPHYEEFVAFLDATAARALVSRESARDPANFGVRDYARGELRLLTRFAHPHPQLSGLRPEVIRYRRSDGVALSGTLYLPPDWQPGGAPRPALLWAYPREFLDAENASQVKATPERFTRVSATGPLPYLLAGYVVLNDPAMPIVARGGGKPNDSYVDQLVASAQAAVDELVRRGVADRERIAVGGHSYGAFMTANLLAHSKLFRAGIARSGAYNRTLTPFGFQSEQRWLWQAPQVYAAMSPFNFAHQIKAPLLLIHGAADNNSGTFPIQTERFYAALKGHGATARYVVLPHEAHSYRARESLLHVLWETESWLNAHLRK